jgi:hypothetical protein
MWKALLARKGTNRYSPLSGCRIFNERSGTPGRKMLQRDTPAVVQAGKEQD